MSRWISKLSSHWLVFPVLAMAWIHSAGAAPTELFISEFIEGSGNNKALEIYNGTGAAVDLSAAGYNIQMFFNGSTSAGVTINLTGTVADGGVYVVAEASAAATILDQADQTNSDGWYNGDDAVVLRKGTTIIDVIGQIGSDPETEWGTGLTSTADNSLRRKESVCAGDTKGTDAFDPIIEWEGSASDNFGGLGAHTASCSASDSAPVVTATEVAGCSQAYTPIYEIQGSGATAAITGQVTTQGVVVGDYEYQEGLPTASLRGFYIQDTHGDRDPATSDGIFVFNDDNNSVRLGKLVRVTGTASDYQDQTQISDITSISICGLGTVAPTTVTLPLPSTNYLERYEGMLVRFPQTLFVTDHHQLGRFGELVLSSGGRLAQPTAVVEPGAPAIARQAANDLNRIILDDASQGQNPDPILFGRAGLPLSASNTLRGGDTATGIVGVMTHTWGGGAASPNAYRVRPINALGGTVHFQPTNPRPDDAPDVGGTIRVVGMNLYNYFNTFDGDPDTGDNCAMGVGGAATDCRGADTQEEFNRQWPKTVAAILATDPDVLGFIELENDGYGDSSAIRHLVDQLNTATAAGTFAFIDADSRTGQTNALGTDAAKVGLIYKPETVTPIGQTAALNTDAFVNAGDSSPRNRPSLAQVFEENASGSRILVVVNHLKSKGGLCDGESEDEDEGEGDGQGHCNRVRVTAVEELAAWLNTDPTEMDVKDVLLIGDFNSYAKEDPIAALEAKGFTNLIAQFEDIDAYSYLFDGQWGYLDHALGSTGLLSRVTGVATYPINADEPLVLGYEMDYKTEDQLDSLYSPDEFRCADHNPVVVGIAPCERIRPTLSLSVRPKVLWLANHQYVKVTASVTASDNLDPTPSVTLVSVTSNEPDNGVGDGDTVNDILILDNYHFKLRAENSVCGKGRIYTITYRAADDCGNTRTRSAKVSVPLCTLCQKIKPNICK